MAALQDDGAARHLVAGLALPDIALPSTQGGSISLAALPGLSVFYVYPYTGRPGTPDPPNWDDIPGAHGSTPEAHGFRDLHHAFQALDVQVFGISAQDTAYQQEFSKRAGLPYALLSDAGGDLRRALSLPVFETGGVAYLKRLTLMATAGTIAQCVYPVSDPSGHARDVLALIKTVRNQRC